MKAGTIIKLLLVPFIGCAIYEGHKNFFNSIPEQIKSAIPKPEARPETNAARAKDLKDDLNFKFSTPTSDNSFIGNAVSGALNKVLENPNGRLIVSEVFQKMVTQSQEITKQDLFFSRYLTRDITNGSGKQAKCGDQVEILYSIQPTNNDTQKEKELKATIVLGMGTLGVGLENGVIGMTEGGKRYVIYSKTSNELYKPKSEKLNATTAEITLVSVGSEQKINKTLGKPFFDKAGAEYVNRTKLICGDIVSGSYSITDLNGTILYDSKNVSFSFKIGEEKIPYEVSAALLGLPAYKATISFITSYPNLVDSFNKLGNFIPTSLLNNKPSSHIILNFHLALSDIN